MAMQTFTTALMDFSHLALFFYLFPFFNFIFINICLYAVPLSQEFYSVKIMWACNIASTSSIFNLLFLVYHYQEQNIHSYHQVPKLLITYKQSVLFHIGHSKSNEQQLFYKLKFIVT